MTPGQRAQRRHDLLLAADLLRRQADADLARLQPAGERVLIWVDAGLWLRRHWLARPRSERRIAAVAAAVAGLAAAAGIGVSARRYGRWLRNGLLAWRVWRLWRG